MEAALAAFARITAVYPQSVVAHDYLAAISWQRGDFRASLRHQWLAQSTSRRGPADEFAELLKTVRRYTLLSEARLYSLYTHARQVCLDDLPGNFVECGVYKGGVSALLAAVVQRYSRRPRRVFAFDTFDGMPEPTVVDRCQGIAANDTPYGAGTLKAPIAENLAVVCRALNVTDLVVPCPGLFAYTLWKEGPVVGAIALLHADADWYESTWQILERLLELVVPHGIVQLDDYGTWEGCRQAVHDFERARGLSFPLRAIDEAGVWFRKDAPLLAAGQHWQALWYAAQAAEQLGDVGCALRAVEGVLRLMPGLIQAREMQLRLLPLVADGDDVG
jgi:hypothetical protein